jgi:hypothetical protein
MSTRQTLEIQYPRPLQNPSLPAAIFHFGWQIETLAESFSWHDLHAAANYLFMDDNLITSPDAVRRAFLGPFNERVDRFNELMLDKIDGDHKTYHSHDTIKELDDRKPTSHWLSKHSSASARKAASIQVAGISPSRWSPITAGGTG